jgi:hypothetical protein
MSMPIISTDGATPAHGKAHDAQDIAAALLLRDVRKMLLEGQPRQAIAHICDVTGVERTVAEGFVAELQSGVFEGE